MSSRPNLDPAPHSGLAQPLPASRADRPATDTAAERAGERAAGARRLRAPAPQISGWQDINRSQIERLFSITDDLLAVISLEGRFLLLNPAWESTLGWERSQMINQPIDALLHPDDRPMIALTAAGAREGTDVLNLSNRCRHSDGSWHSLLWSARCDGNCWYASAKDITHRISLERQALHDALTKLPNRQLLMDRIRRALQRLQRSKDLVALMFIDLDRFKAVNDNLGHAIGDEMLIAIAKRLSEVVRDSDTVARLGGDEFVLLAEELHSDNEALSLAERVLHALQEPVDVGSAVVSIKASVGISICHHAQQDAEELLHQADVAMYRAKADQGRRVGLFDETLRAELSSRLQVEADLRHAVARQELRLLYQPMFALSDMTVLACEALIRWHPHDRPPLSAGEFLHLAEESDLIVQIGQWALQSACLQAAAWRREGVPITVAVNVSARGLAQIDIAAAVRQALSYAEIPPQALCLEFAEEAVVRDLSRARSTLRSCRELGAQIALDRFGAGPSSLSLPGELPLDLIKIDTSLLLGIETDRAKRASVLAITALARELGIGSAAVGIETEDQLRLARAMGCALGQGFLLRKPDSAQQLRLQQREAIGSPLRWRSIRRLRRQPHRSR